VVRSVRRRLLVPALLALCAGAAAGAALASSGDDPLQGREWFLAAVGAVQTAPEGPGAPLTIVDSGVDASQPDFAGRPDTTYLNAQTVTGPSEFHGTEVASVAAAPANGIGIVGVYPQAALNVWDAPPGPGELGPASVAASLAAAPCPGVVNLSFGAPARTPSLDAAVAAAQRRGCLVVAAAGNLASEGNPVVYPAADLHVLAVGASDEAGARAPFSESGAWVDLFAPGVGIEVDTTVEHDPSGNVVDAGTSFSSSIVAAAAARVWTARPKLSAAQLFALLKGTAQNGIVNIPAALAAPAPPDDPREPNDTAAEAALQPALTTKARRTNRIAGTLDAVKDPRDLYRISVPPRGRARLSVTGPVVARVVGSFVQVTLRGASSARYVLSIRPG
jgi:Subtilase family